MEQEENPPQRLAQYELVEEIGRGGMGVVYRARDTRLGRQAAVKVLPAMHAGDANLRARMLREARAAAILNHPAIATVYEVGETHCDDPKIAGSSGDVFFLAMEHVEGEDLRAHIQRGLPVHNAIDFAIQIADGLAAAHQAGVIHRDLKPGNLRVTPDARIKILDFGLAQITLDPESSITSTRLTRSGGIVGTLPYMSMEQIDGKDLDARTDLFSLGVVLYQMLTGRRPFESGGVAEYIKDLMRNRPEPASSSNPEVSADLDGILRGLLARDRKDRYSSAAEVAEALRAIADGRRPTTTHELTEVTRPPAPRRGTPLRAALALLAVLAVAGGLGLFLLRRGEGSPPVRNLAVLPFENRTDEPGRDAYYEGVGEALARKLSKVRGLNVASGLDLRRYRETTLTASEIAREIDAGTLVRGYVQGTSERIRIVVQVLHAAPSGTIWDVEVEGSPGELLELQEELADRLIASLPVSLSQRERQRFSESPTASREAYEVYARAAAALEQLDRPDKVEQAVELFRRALEIDSEFSWAHAGLSMALVRYHRHVRDPELLVEALRAADRAVALEPDLPQPKITRARALLASGLHAEAVTALGSALALHPDLDTAYTQLGICYYQLGELELAERSYRRTLDIRPRWWLHWNQLGTFFLRTGRYAEARKPLEKAVALAPRGIVRPLENLATLSFLVGDPESALATLARIPESERAASVLTNMGSAAFALGRFEEAEKVYRKVLDLQPREPYHWLSLGDAQLRRGDDSAALASYRQGRDLIAEELARNPGYDRLLSLEPVLWAKAGDCPGALAKAETRRAEIAGKTEDLLHVAKTYAVCGERALALSAIEELVAAGMSQERLRGEFELEWLLGAPEPEAILE